MFSSSNDQLSIAEKLMLEDINQTKPNIQVDGSRVVDFYKNKSVFLTGATGFLGKLIVEKLLRVCKDVKTIYVMVRPKRNDDEDTRFKKIYDNHVFSVLLKQRPQFKQQIRMVKGDCALPNLGLSDHDRQLLIENVNVIFHVAATVKFDEKLKIATTINIQGAKKMLTLAKECKNLVSYVHVSTAFSNCNHPEIKENFYEPPITAEALIKIVNESKEDVLENLTPSLLKGWPNTYVFTKQVAEDAVMRDGKGLPICVFRPSIVASTLREPLRSWHDNLYGVTGATTAAGVGFLHSFHCDDSKLAEVVPGDYVTNAMIALAHQTALKTRSEITVYNYVSGVENPITWREYLTLTIKYGLSVPTIHIVWCFWLLHIKNYFLNSLCAFLLLTIPCLLMDVAMVLAGKKAKMLNVARRIAKMDQVMSPFCTKEWQFSNTNTQEAWKQLSKVDKDIFPFSMKTFDWDDFQKTYWAGLRVYLLKDDLSTVPAAKKRYNRFVVYQRIAIAVLVMVFAKLLYGIFNVFL